MRRISCGGSICRDARADQVVGADELDAGEGLTGVHDQGRQADRGEGVVNEETGCCAEDDG